MTAWASFSGGYGALDPDGGPIRRSVVGLGALAPAMEGFRVLGLGPAPGEPATQTGCATARETSDMAYELKLFSGNANRPLAEEIAKTLQLPLGDADVSRFSDGEIYVQINENVRGAGRLRDPADVPAGQRSPDGAAHHDRRAQARVGRRITAVMPYYGYGAPGPQGAGPRTPITAKLVADLHHRRGRRPRARDRPARRADPGLLQHPGRPPLRRAACIVDYLAKKDLQDPVLVSPDAGGVERARAFAKRLKAGLAIIDKRRDGNNVAGVHEPHRRRQGQGRGHRRRHDRHRGHADPGGGGASSARARGASSPARRTACSPARPSSASRSRCSKRSSSPTRSR